MADYKEMYFHLFREVEKAVRILQKAQLDCEEIYISTPGVKAEKLEQSRVIPAEEKEAV